MGEGRLNRSNLIEVSDSQLGKAYHLLDVAFKNLSCFGQEWKLNLSTAVLSLFHLVED